MKAKNKDIIKEQFCEGNNKRHLKEEWHYKGAVKRTSSWVSKGIKGQLLERDRSTEKETAKGRE